MPAYGPSVWMYISLHKGEEGVPKKKKRVAA